jgi:hypothetical protein
MAEEPARTFFELPALGPERGELAAAESRAHADHGVVAAHVVAADRSQQVSAH